VKFRDTPIWRLLVDGWAELDAGASQEIHLHSANCFLRVRWSSLSLSHWISVVFQEKKIMADIRPSRRHWNCFSL